ncbi:MAG: PDZ domain-containing protein [Planctomycetaceae bacterium]
MNEPLAPVVRRAGAAGIRGDHPFVRPRAWLAATLSTLIIVSGTAAAGDEPAPFVPGEISIGEPLPLPGAAPTAPPPPRFGAIPSAAPAAPRAPATTGGWFGWTLDDSVVVGRLVVVAVAADGPAARAGIRPQDILVALDGKRPATVDELSSIVAGLPAGRTVAAAVARADGIEEVSLTPQAAPPPAAARRSSATVAPAADWQPATEGEPPPTPAVVRSRTPSPPTAPAANPDPPRRLADPAGAGGRPALGVRTRPVDPAIQARFALPRAAGALVIGVVHELPASRAGVPPGAVIIALDERAVESPDDLSRLVAAGPIGTPVTIRYVLPGGGTHDASVSLERLSPALERALVSPPLSAGAGATADE